MSFRLKTLFIWIPVHLTWDLSLSNSFSLHRVVVRVMEEMEKIRQTDEER